MPKHTCYLARFLVLLCIASGGAAGCGPSKVAGKAVLDCLAADAAGIDQTIIDLGTKTRPDGTRDWGAIESTAIGHGLVIGGCALAQFVQTYLSPGTGVKAPADGLEARQTLEHFRATEAGGATFKTRLGAL